MTERGVPNDKFTGEGIMAVFGAPVALEDHALRACRAALDIHSAIRDLADEVGNRDGVDLRWAADHNDLDTAAAIAFYAAFLGLWVGTVRADFLGRRDH